MDDLERNMKFSENMAAHAMKAAVEQAGKYNWTNSDQRAAAILGYMNVFGRMMAMASEPRTPPR